MRPQSVRTAICLPRPLSRPCWLCRWPAARPRATTPPARSAPPARRKATPTRGARSTSLSARYQANPGDAEAAIAYAKALRATEQRAQAVAVLEQASIRNPNNMTLLGAYGRALADAGNYAAGARCAQPRAHAGPAGLAHPQRARRGARPDGPPRRCAAVLFERAQDRAGRAFGAVQSRPVLRAVEGSRARRDDAAPCRGARRTRARRCGRTSRWWSACKAASPKPRRSRAPTCRPTKPPPTSPICGRCCRSRTI